jgi:hypothetical protein
MIQFRHQTLLILLIIIFILSTSGCALVSLKNWFEQDGKILYEDNGQPVPNAIVAAVWRGKNSDAEDAGTICYHVETTRSDNDGKFRIPGWREYFEFSKITDKEVSFVIYKPGFWSPEALLKVPAGTKPGVYKLQSLSKENRQTNSKFRLKYLQKLVGLTSCNITSVDRPKLEDLYAGILSEAEDVASTAIDKKIVKSLRNWTSFVAASN